MGKGIRNDLTDRLTKSHEEGRCLTPTSQSDAHRLRNAYRRGDLVCPARQVYALPDQWASLNPLEREQHKLRALAQLHPAWVFANVSAAVLYGLDVSYSLLGTVHLACGRRSHTRDSPRIKRHAVHNDEPAQVGNAHVTSLERTVFDCTRSYPFPLALGIADSALRVSGMPYAAFTDSFSAMHRRHRNVWRAVEVMALASPLAENGGESYARAIMIRQGYMIPQLQVEVPDAVDQNKTYRVDFYWDLPRGPVAGELDGHDKYTDPHMTGGRDIVEVLTDERLRESHITAAVKVVRFSFKDVLRTGRFCRLLSSFGVPRGYAVPRVART